VGHAVHILDEAVAKTRHHHAQHAKTAAAAG
jgi:hypothetical protein